MKKAKRGVVLFGLNNEKVDYLRLCVASAGLIKANMGDIPVTLVTNEWSMNWNNHNVPEQIERRKKLFQNIVVLEKGGERNKNQRIYRDTRYWHTEASFRNENRASAFFASPYEETLLLDCDYLVLGDSLNAVWGSGEEMLMSRDAINLYHLPFLGGEHRLNPFGLRMYWATAIYFRKTEGAQLIFDLVAHVRDNWEFYNTTYDLPGRLFRNDFAFSIAIHILSGSTEPAAVPALPDSPLLTSLDHDAVHAINGTNDITFLVNDQKEEWKYTVSRVRGINVHCMNKLSLMSKLDELERKLQ